MLVTTSFPGYHSGSRVSLFETKKSKIKKTSTRRLSTVLTRIFHPLHLAEAMERDEHVAEWHVLLQHHVHHALDRFARIEALAILVDADRNLGHFAWFKKRKTSKSRKHDKGCCCQSWHMHVYTHRERESDSEQANEGW